MFLYQQRSLPKPDVKDRALLLPVPYIASLESERGRPPSRSYWKRRERGRGRLGASGKERGSARGGSFLSGARCGAGRARRPPVQPPVRARWRLAIQLFRVWLYVAREWRQNSNEQPQLEARLPPAPSRICP